MSITTIASVSDQIQKFWAPMFTKELREQLLLGSLINKEYQGEIKKGGDTVYVSQINAPTGQLRTVGIDANTYASDALSTTRIAIAANKRAVASFEFEDLVDLQSQIGAEDSEIRQSLLFAVEKQVNNYLYGLVAPSVSHTLTGVTNFDASQLLTVRKLAAQSKWLKEKGWWLLADPTYMNDLLNAQTMTNSQYTGGDAPVVGGQIATQRFGFNILEDNSRSSQHVLAFHPDFMHLVMQKEVQFKVSDQHANGKFGYVISADMIFGASLGIAGDSKHVTVKNV
jgi:hypothetical protein